MTLRLVRIDNGIVSLDHFLDFWSHYNQTIIQALIVITLIFIVALVFITLFGEKSEESAGSTQVGLSPELEKSLQKMLDNQTKAAVFDFTKGSQDAGAPSSLAAIQPTNPEIAMQMEKLKAEMLAKEKKIQELNAQLLQVSSQQTKELKVEMGAGLEARIKELEARLAEYDIISEDIADLSRYKDENEKLKAELAALRGGSAPQAQPPPAQPQAPVAAAPTPAAPPAQAAPAPQPAAPAAPDAAVSAAIDDDLMKEFAAAVEGQKTATQAPPVAAATTSENEDLMGQFENFVQKKEGS